MKKKLNLNPTDTDQLKILIHYINEKKFSEYILYTFKIQIYITTNLKILPHLPEYLFE